MAWTPANSLLTNPIVLEVFNADVTVSATPVIVKTITVTAATAGDRFYLKTKAASEAASGGTIPRVVVDMGIAVAKETEILDFGDGGFEFESLYFDTSDPTHGLAAGDRVLIYLK